MCTVQNKWDQVLAAFHRPCSTVWGWPHSNPCVKPLWLKHWLKLIQGWETQCGVEENSSSGIEFLWWQNGGCWWCGVIPFTTKPNPPPHSHIHCTLEYRWCLKYDGVFVCVYGEGVVVDEHGVRVCKRGWNNLADYVVTDCVCPNEKAVLWVLA